MYKNLPVMLDHPDRFRQAGGLKRSVRVSIQRYKGLERYAVSHVQLSKSRPPATDIVQAYVSVAYDASRVTITAPRDSILSLQERLKAAGLTITDVKLNGRFHWKGHLSALKVLQDFCSSDARFHLPDAANSSIPTRSNLNGEIIQGGSLLEEALKAILVEQPQWYQIFKLVKSTILSQPDALVVSFGTPCVPPSITRGHNLEVLSMSDYEASTPYDDSQRNRKGYLDTDIAVVGMALKAPGANDVEQFWDLLCKGKSQHKEVPKDRFEFDTAFREVDPKRKWFGNFIESVSLTLHKSYEAWANILCSTTHSTTSFSRKAPARSPHRTLNNGSYYR